MTYTTPAMKLANEPRPIGLVVLSAVALVALLVGAGLAFAYAPLEREMGFVQKIFYFHVPAAWAMLMSAPLLAVGSVAYLINRMEIFDRIADAGVELAILFGLMVLISGPLWGRKAWGVFWVWDVRLTSTLVMVLTLVACKIVRSYAGAQAKGISAGLSLLSVVNAAFVWFAVDIWKGTHPEKVVQKEGGLAPEMRTALLVCVLAFTLAYGALLWERLRVGRLNSALEELEMQATEAGLE